MGDPLARNLLYAAPLFLHQLSAPVQLGFQLVNGVIELIALVLHMLQACGSNAIGFLQLRGLPVSNVVHV